MFVLIRDIFTETAILGRLCFCGRVICNTLENRSKAIPCGLYSMLNSMSPKFKRELPLIWNEGVPERRGIRIHRGNSAKDSKGCILVGMSRDVKKNFITESTNAEVMVTMLCRNEKNIVIVDACANK